MDRKCENCENCEWFMAREDSGDWNPKEHEEEWDGFCRRNAPQPIIVEDNDDHDETYVYWPRVFTQEWCGEFKPKN